MLVESSCKRHVLGALGLAKGSIFFERFIGPKTNQMKILTLLDENKLDLSASLFKITM
jgi:hypothetical protein